MMIMMPMLMVMMMMVKLISQVVLASADLAGRAKGTGRPAEPDFALVPNIGIIVSRSAKSLFVEKTKIKGKYSTHNIPKNCHNSISLKM